MKGGILVLRIITKTILFPITILLTLIELICSLVVRISDIFFRLIAGILILAGLLSFGFGLEPWSATVQSVLGGVVFLAIPFTATLLNAGISALNMLLRTI